MYMPDEVLAPIFHPQPSYPSQVARLETLAEVAEEDGGEDVSERAENVITINSQTVYYEDVYRGGRLPH